MVKGCKSTVEETDGLLRRWEECRESLEYFGVVDFLKETNLQLIIAYHALNDSVKDSTAHYDDALFEGAKSLLLSIEHRIGDLMEGRLPEDMLYLGPGK
jgi:hypothetical protein